MRLWHQALIPKLPRAQILGQHREICALRGNGWGKKHSTVDYVFTHPMEWLVAFHHRVIGEMGRRGYKVDTNWTYASYRGKSCALKYEINFVAYLQECIDNLRAKGVEIE